MSRNTAIHHAETHFDTGAFEAMLARRVAIPTESQNPTRTADLLRYLTEEMMPEFTALGFKCALLETTGAKAPFLYAERIEDPKALTVLGYGHGDVVRGDDANWKPGLDPWTLTKRNDKWYGRGIVDNKGQHSINMAALRAVLETRGSLGFNAKYIIEMGEEVGSPGLRKLCEANCERFRANLLIASDGPRLKAENPLIFLGARGAMLIDLEISAREGGHHSGNWGGLLSNPAIQLAHAIAVIVGPNGQIRIPELVPKVIPAAVKAALAGIEIDGGADGPKIEPWWGEPGLSAAEKVFGWCNFEVLAFEAGNPREPVNAIPPRAFARCQLRFVVDIDESAVMPAIEAHLARHGLGHVKVSSGREDSFKATRLNPAHPYVDFVRDSIAKTTGKPVTVLPNLGGALPNDIFVEVLDLPTIWVPHSYAGCSQHAPNEHVPASLFREALGLMAGLYWDLAELEL